MRIIKIIVLISLVQIPFLFANYGQDIRYANKVLEERLIERAINTAMFDANVAINEYARIELIESTPELVIEPKDVINTFLNSLSIQLGGITVNEGIKYMVPFIAIVDVDGVYFYEVVEENKQLVSKFYEKESYVRKYPDNIEIQYYLNDHIRTYKNGVLTYDGLYYDKESIVPNGFDYEAEKIAATVNHIEERMNGYFNTWLNESSTISLPRLSEEDWDNASGDVTMYALVYQMGSKPIRMVNNCGIKNHFFRDY